MEKIGFKIFCFIVILVLGKLVLGEKIMFKLS